MQIHPHPKPFRFLPSPLEGEGQGGGKICVYPCSSVVKIFETKNLRVLRARRVKMKI